MQCVASFNKYSMPKSNAFLGWLCVFIAIFGLVLPSRQMCRDPRPPVRGLPRCIRGPCPRPEDCITASEGRVSIRGLRLYPWTASTVTTVLPSRQYKEEWTGWTRRTNGCWFFV